MPQDEPFRRFDLVDVVCKRLKEAGIENAKPFLPDARRFPEFAAVRCGVPGAEDAAFDVLVSNPPYIPSALVEELPAEVGGFEPRLALDGGPDGLDVFRRIVALAGTALKPGGLLACELHEECLEQACDEAVSGGLLQNARIVKDLAGKNRILLAERL